MYWRNGRSKTIRGEIVAIQQCRNIKSGNKILNFNWINTKDANIFLVTSLGIELYGFSAHKRAMSLIKCIKYETVYYWYLPSLQFLMLVNRSFVFYGIKLSYLKTEKINKFEIVGIDRQRREDLHRQITLIEIGSPNKEQIGCIFIDERKTKLYLFKVIRHQMQLTHSYHLYSNGKYTIFHIDHVLVAYNKNTEMPILIDFNGNNYISAPLPITMCYYEGNDPNKPKRIFSTQKHLVFTENIKTEHTQNHKKRVSKSPPKVPPPAIHHQHPQNHKNKNHEKDEHQNQNENLKQKQMKTKNPKIARKRYRFISPLFILEEWTERYQNGHSFDSGNFYTLSLNLSAIVHSWGPERQIPLLHFLLHRDTNDSKTIIVKMLYDMIKFYCCGYKLDLRSRLDFISEYFIVLNEVLRRAVEESATIAQSLHEQQLLKQQQKKQLLAKNQSFTARFRKQSQSYAQKLFGTPPNTPPISRPISSSNHKLSGLPPPPFPSRSKSAANIPEATEEQFLPAPHMNGMGMAANHSHSHNQNASASTAMGRRVAATVKFDLEKTSHGETVIKTTEILEEIFNPIYNVLVRKDQEIAGRRGRRGESKENENENEHEHEDEDKDFKLYDDKEWTKSEIGLCLNRFLSVLIEYTRTMHRI